MNGFKDTILILGTILSLSGTVVTIIAQASEKTDVIVKRYIVYPAFNREAIKSNIDQYMKSKFGLLFIIIGSVIQIFSTVSRDYVIPSTYAVVVLLCALLIPIGLYQIYLIPRIKKIQKMAIDEASRIANGSN